MSLENQENDLSLLYTEAIHIELGLDLISLGVNKSESLLSSLPKIRRILAQEMGLQIPPVKLQDNRDIPFHQYCIHIRGNEMASGELYMDKVLAVAMDLELPQLQGIATKDPTFGVNSFWIPPEAEETAIISGYAVVTPLVVLNTHIQETFRRHADLIFDYSAFELYLEQATSSSSMLEKACKEKSTVIFSVLKRLLAEGISIRDQQSILEVIVSSEYTDVDTLTSLVRRQLRYQIRERVTDSDGVHALVFSEELLHFFEEKQDTESPLSTSLKQQLSSEISIIREKIHHCELVILCPEKLRNSLRFISKMLFVPILCREELPEDTVIHEEEIITIVLPNQLG